MARYRITPKGDAALCRAEAGKCPFGEQALHGNSPEEVRAAYEATHPQLPQVVRKKKPAAGDYLPEDRAAELLRSREYDERLWQRRQEAGTRRLDDWEEWQAAHPGEALTPLPTAPKKVSVFRSGGVTPEAYEGEVAFYTDLADHAKPEEQLLRHGALFASSDGKGLRRWPPRQHSVFSA